MPKTLILVRHAEALHNVNQEYHLHDPILSDKGLRQCEALNQHLRESQPLAQKIELIVVSPLKRTLQTAQLSFDWLIKAGVPVIPHASLQEVSPAACDTGSELSLISEEFPSIDFSGLDVEFPSKKGKYAYTSSAVLARGQEMLRWLYSRPEKVIAVVSHASFLRIGMGKCFFVNADYRIFDYEDLEMAAIHGINPALKLKERRETKVGGGYLERPDSEWAEIMDWDFPDEKSGRI